MPTFARFLQNATSSDDPRDDRLVVSRRESTGNSIYRKRPCRERRRNPCPCTRPERVCPSESVRLLEKLERPVLRVIRLVPTLNRGVRGPARHSVQPRHDGIVIQAPLYERANLRGETRCPSQSSPTHRIPYRQMAFDPTLRTSNPSVFMRAKLTKSSRPRSRKLCSVAVARPPSRRNS